MTNKGQACGEIAETNWSKEVGKDEGEIHPRATGHCQKDKDKMLTTQ